jgi:hypothetical protein
MWEGKIKKISNMVNNLEKKIDSRFKTQREEISENKAQMKNMVA